MIYMNKKEKDAFDSRPVIVMEDDNSIRLDKLILMADMTDEEIKNLEKEEWDVIYKNGDLRDVRKCNLEIVVFKDDDFFKE